MIRWEKSESACINVHAASVQLIEYRERHVENGMEMWYRSPGMIRQAWIVHLN